MAERLNNYEREKNPEALERFGHERDADLRHERDKNALERRDEKSTAELQRDAERAAEREKKKLEKEVAPAERKRDTPAQRKAKGKASHDRIVKQTQDHLKPGERAFSKVIHNKTVEKTSEVVGSTVARPNAILAGSLTAFLLTLAVYLVARYFGYPLSGAETIASFALGWAVGLLFDYLRVMITGKKA